MPPYLYLYCDEASCAVLENPAEKVFLVGSDFGYGNFGDILQHINTIRFHAQLGRHQTVCFMAANAIGDVQFPLFVRQAYGMDAVVFVSEYPLDLSQTGLNLQPLRLVCNAAALHLYGGGFLNDKWGDFVLGVTEFLLHHFHLSNYVVSGQQVTRPYESRVLRHIQAYQPKAFAVRDGLSHQWLSEAGYVPEFSFDDATEALQSLTSTAPLQKGTDLLIHVNVSEYTGQPGDAQSVRDDLHRLRDSPHGSEHVTLLQAFTDKRKEVIDTRESIKSMERHFPFFDTRSIELTALAYDNRTQLRTPIAGALGYSCSYHVALWLQLAGIPCWLKGSNAFYQQKTRALQVRQDLPSFLRDPQLADHAENLEQREAWMNQLRQFFTTSSELPNAVRFIEPNQSLQFPLTLKGQTSANPVDVPAQQGEPARTETDQEQACFLEERCRHLNDKLTAIGHEFRDLERRSEATIEVLRTHSDAVDAQLTSLGSLCRTLTEKIEQKDIIASDLNKQVVALTQSIEQKDAGSRVLVQDLMQSRSDAASLFNQLDQVLHSHSWKLTRPLRIAMRFVQHGHLDSAGQKGVFQLARFVGKRLPFPIWVKTRVRTALLQWRYRETTKLPSRYEPVTHAPQVSGGALFGVLPGRPTRAEFCALQSGLVSVVLPVFNQANLLEESIQSVLAQTYQDFELIVINDGSNDGVETVLEKYLDHPKVRCYTQANQRLPKALSNGFSFAKGEFWTWTSADNIMEPKMLELLVGKLRLEPDLGMVYADYYAIDDRGALLQDRTWRANNRPNPPSGEIRLPHTTENLNIVQDNFIGPCFMYRGWIGRCMGDYDPQLGIEDYDYWMRINAFFPIRHLGTPDLLYRYRVHDNTLSAKASEHRILEKAQRLMDYERKRAAFYRARMVIVADAVGLEWLKLGGLSEAELLSLCDASGALCIEEMARADLVLVCSASAVANRLELATLTTPTAVFFDKDDRYHQKLQHLLNRPGCLALAPSQLAADRVKLVADCPIVDAGSAHALTAVVAFAKNHRHFHATRATEELQRELPRQLLRPNGQHVLLQVDSFMQGGMENVVIDLAQSLQDMGFEVTIANLGSAGDAADKARDNGLRVETFGSGLSTAEYIDWLHNYRVTLVNAHYSIFGAAACEAAGIPFIETIHNAYVWLDEEVIHRYREADPHITGYICVSKTAAQYADVVLGLDVSKMRVISNGIDAQNVDATQFSRNRDDLRTAWKIPPSAPMFLNVASMMATKAQLPMVKAFARVLQEHPEARLVLLGSMMEKPYQEAVEKAVRDLKLQQRVIFAGYHRDVARYYHAADVFVLPSYWEGWSLSLGEAMANGLSCVITDVGSAYEFEGNPRVEIVPAPFGDITELNRNNLGRYVYGEDQSFIESLANAMVRSARHSRGPVDIDLAHRLDRRIAYRQYAEAFVLAAH